MWLNVVALGGMDAFRDLTDAVVRSDSALRAWYDAEAPERAPVPGYEERLSKFERTCIVKARRSAATNRDSSAHAHTLSCAEMSLRRHKLTCDSSNPYTRHESYVMFSDCSPLLRAEHAEGHRPGARTER